MSRSTIQLSEQGKRDNCPKPQLGRNEAGVLTYWVKPIGQPAALRIRLEGLKGFFKKPEG